MQSHLAEVFAARDMYSEARQKYLEALQAANEAQIAPQSCAQTSNLSSRLIKLKRFDTAPTNLCLVLKWNNAAPLLRDGVVWVGKNGYSGCYPQVKS